MNTPVERILHNDRLIALIIRASFQSEGITFFTPGDFSQQVAYMQRPKGYEIAPHVHKSVSRKVVETQEVLFIKNGSLRVDFYSSEKALLETRILKKGDTILLASGGHGFSILEDSTEILEVKQGPYLEDQDKERFIPLTDGENS